MGYVALRCDAVQCGMCKANATEHDTDLTGAWYYPIPGTQDNLILVYTAGGGEWSSPSSFLANRQAIERS
jgi:hypothetical protein